MKTERAINRQIAKTNKTKTPHRKLTGRETQMHPGCSRTRNTDAPRVLSYKQI